MCGEELISIAEIYKGAGEKELDPTRASVRRTKDNQACGPTLVGGSVAGGLRGAFASMSQMGGLDNRGPLLHIKGVLAVAGSDFLPSSVSQNDGSIVALPDRTKGRPWAEDCRMHPLRGSRIDGDDFRTHHKGYPRQGGSIHKNSIKQ